MDDVAFLLKDRSRRDAQAFFVINNKQAGRPGKRNETGRFVHRRPVSRLIE
jgi:hypothetical protein